MYCRKIFNVSLEVLDIFPFEVVGENNQDKEESIGNEKVCMNNSSV